MNALKISFSRTCHMLLGDFRAKRSQDDNPLPQQETVRAASVDYAPWSHPSLRSRRGTRLSATRPQLARVNLPPSIRPQPFGLALRFDRTPSGNAAFQHLAPEVANQFRETRARLAQFKHEGNPAEHHVERHI